MKKNYRMKNFGLTALAAIGLLANTVQAQTYTFTCASAIGRTGPTQAQLNTAYAATNLNGSVTTVNGIQQFTVPTSGMYSIDTKGAAGGNSIFNYRLGDIGARAKGDFSLTAGQVLNILVGQTFNPTYTVNNQFSGGGGGGGSFVWLSTATVPLVVAGGGGGAGANQGTSYNGVAGVVTTSGTASSGSFVSTGGVNGNGGNENSGNGEHAHGGSAGGGWLTDGASVISAAQGGFSILYGNGLGGYNGAFGGQVYGSDGGFGGGGGATIGGGGGGGYSGGGAGSQPYSGGWFENGGGGGGSFNSGANQVMTPSVNPGNGIVIISLLCNPGATPTNTTLVANQNICANASTTLNVIGTGTLNWYATNASTVVLGTGSVYVTPTLAVGVYTYYAASTNTCSEGSRVPVTVTVNASPSLAIAGPTAAICGGSPANITASGAATYSWSNGAATASIAPTPTANASYTVVGTSSLGCSSNAVISVTVTAAPSVSVAGAGTICTGQSATLTASGANSYSWNTGASTSSIVVTPTANTSYTAMGTSSVTGCTGNSVVNIVVSTCLGVSQTGVQASDLKAYPNPSNGEFTIEMNNNFNKTIEVSDLTGRVVLSNKTSKDKVSVNISSFANGIYYVKVQTANATEVIKIVKQ